MIIENYEVIINEKKSMCGFVVNEQDYHLASFQNEKLFFNVDTKEKNIHVFNENKTKNLVFINTNLQVIFYAVQNGILPIAIGNYEEEVIFKFILEASLK